MTKPFQNKDWDAFRSLEGMVRITLIAVWDPIGIFGHAQTLNEYDNFVLPIVWLLKSDASIEQLERHLRQVHQEIMGIRMNNWTTRADRLAVETLVQAFKNFNF